jgi:hypothetical protein
LRKIALDSETFLQWYQAPDGSSNSPWFVRLNYLNPPFTALDEITSIGIDKEASRFINDDRAYQTFWRASENQSAQMGELA